ncbi:unnamed protein product [Pieris brassicae]|uniref:Uncharacterized protein n=1 Tax=Pieris brassicae TaxID=7116 RepID=A0A9P0TLT1_PIEBR|nr:unnamed protein product [Pieris brassicae]
MNTFAPRAARTSQGTERRERAAAPVTLVLSMDGSLPRSFIHDGRVNGARGPRFAHVREKMARPPKSAGRPMLRSRRRGPGGSPSSSFTTFSADSHCSALDRFGRSAISHAPVTSRPVPGYLTGYVRSLWIKIKLIIFKTT